jgi:SAM-dependent methyltransferase
MNHLDTGVSAARGAALPHSTAISQRARLLYAEPYARRYSGLYILPWRQKHNRNLTTLARLLDHLSRRSLPDWLDLACGPAWHFSMLAGRARMCGVDISPAQLEQARREAPHAHFVCADMSEDVNLAPSMFDLVTNFWGGYCYLDSEDRIASWLTRAVRWLRPNGALYMELLLGADLAAFNSSRFARDTGFRVEPRRPDHSQWHYDDLAGRHAMTSPPLEFFLDHIGPSFDHVDAQHDGGFMVHLVARGRR